MTIRCISSQHIWGPKPGESLFEDDDPESSTILLTDGPENCTYDVILTFTDRAALIAWLRATLANFTQEN